MTTLPDTLVQTGVGSYDWHGNVAPAGGSHTGQCVITMQDGATFTVAHSVAEVRAKKQAGSNPANPGQWVAFDVPLTSSPVVLNAGLIASP